MIVEIRCNAEKHFEANHERRILSRFFHLGKVNTFGRNLLTSANMDVKILSLRETSRPSLPQKTNVRCEDGCAERDHDGGCSFVFKATPLAILIRDLVNPATNSVRGC